LAGQCFPALSAAGQRAAGLNLFQSLAATGKFLLDGFDRGCPNERSGMFIPDGQKFRDGLLETKDIIV
jgi:hypothetical protein